MILTPSPLQKPTLNTGALRLQSAGAPARTMAPSRPVLQTLRVPQQLCLDLQTRSR
jgi:hypothetical protein